MNKDTPIPYCILESLQQETAWDFYDIPIKDQLKVFEDLNVWWQKRLEEFK